MLDISALYKKTSDKIRENLGSQSTSTLEKVPRNKNITFSLQCKLIGGTIGIIGATGYGVANGNLSGGTIYRAYVTGALSGAAIGTYTPV